MNFVLKEGLEVEQLIQVVAAEMEVKAIVGANGSSELEGSKRNRRGGNIKSTFSSNMDMRVCGCATAGSGYYRYAERQYDIKNKKEGSRNSLFSLLPYSCSYTHCSNYRKQAHKCY